MVEKFAQSAPQPPYPPTRRHQSLKKHRANGVENDVCGHKLCFLWTRIIRSGHFSSGVFYFLFFLFKMCRRGRGICVSFFLRAFSFSAPGLAFFVTTFSHLPHNLNSAFVAATPEQDGGGEVKWRRGENTPELSSTRNIGLWGGERYRCKLS